MRTARTVLIGVLLLPFIYSGDDQPNQLQQVQQRGSITLLTRNGASSYYLDAEGPTGPEYELVRQFSEFLGVELEIEVASAFSQLSGMLDRGKGDLIAANLTRTSARERAFNFGPDYLETRILAVYRRGKTKPLTMTDLAGLKVMIIAGSSYEEALESAQNDIPELSWEARSDVGIEDLLLAVSDEAIDVTLVDSNIFSINKSFYPKISTAFVVKDLVPHAWAFRHGADHSLSEQARAFILQVKLDGRLAKVIERFYSYKERLDQYSMYHFLSRARNRLPMLIDAFREAGDANGIDWRLLAAIGYQESHWDSKAESYTGVRGIMMLTEQTADQLGIVKRLDP